MNQYIFSVITTIGAVVVSSIVSFIVSRATLKFDRNKTLALEKEKWANQFREATTEFLAMSESVIRLTLYDLDESQGHKRNEELTTLRVSLTRIALLLPARKRQPLADLAKTHLDHIADFFYYKHVDDSNNNAEACLRDIKAQFTLIEETAGELLDEIENERLALLGQSSVKKHRRTCRAKTARS